MKLSQLFTKTLRENPADEVSINARLLIKGGFVSKVMSGVYEFMPLGLKVLNKINDIIREEINSIGGQEIFMSVLQNKETWDISGRWQSAKEIMYQLKDSSGKELGLGWTHEEPLTNTARHYINSYKDLPKSVYQIQTKFRNEPRAKSGLLRSREFLMKDMYSFHADEDDLNNYYEKAADAYLRIFDRSGLKAIRTLASGGLFSEFSDEFQVISDIGEDSIFYCEKCNYAENKEVNRKNKCSKCEGKLKEFKSIEVGNIFKLGTKFSEAFGLFYVDENGAKAPVIMASYGIGPGRLMAAVVETSHDEKGIVWPENIAPFQYYLIFLDGKNSEAEKVYGKLISRGKEVLFDDRDDKTAGEKFADADLIGCPVRLVISSKSLEAGGVEVKKRSERDSKIVFPDSI